MAASGFPIGHLCPARIRSRTSPPRRSAPGPSGRTNEIPSRSDRTRTPGERTMSKILFVLTGADHWTLADGTLHPTGFWAEEAAAPYEAFKAAGHDVVVATPGGVVPTVDQGSLAPEFNGGQEG